MNISCVMLALVLGRVVPTGLGGDAEEFSTSRGGGSFYAVRHAIPGQKPRIEVIGSGIALTRAKNQAKEGNYKLEIKGPFPWHLEALGYIRKNWDPEYGHPPKVLDIVVTPVPERERRKPQEPQKDAP